MTKRVFWLATGFGLGVVASVRTRRRIARLAPADVATRVRDEVAAALAEGRTEMRAREAALRTVLAAPGERDAGR